MVTKPPCDTCRLVAEQAGKEPDCYECLPELYQSNRKVYEVFRRVQGQHIMGASGKPIGLNLAAVYPVMDMVDISDKLFCLDLLQQAYHATMEAIEAKHNK